MTLKISVSSRMLGRGNLTFWVFRLFIFGEEYVYDKVREKLAKPIFYVMMVCLYDILFRWEVDIISPRRWVVSNQAHSLLNILGSGKLNSF